MKKLLWLAVLMGMLSGCAGAETFETVSDEMVVQVSSQARQTVLELPDEAASPTVESDSGRLYLCEGYEISVQTLQGGDLAATIRSVSGYDPGELTIMHTADGETERYEFVWACAGEGGERIGRALILDDGAYHYVLTVLGETETARANHPVWLRMFQSFRLA